MVFLVALKRELFYMTLDYLDRPSSMFKIMHGNSLDSLDKGSKSFGLDQLILDLMKDSFFNPWLKVKTLLKGCIKWRNTKEEQN